MLKQTGFALLTLALGACSAVAPGKRADPAHPGYVTSAGGIVTNPFGACWHTRAWTPDKAVTPCDRVAVVQASTVRCCARKVAPSSTRSQ